MKNLNKNKSGFTVVEVLLVILTLAIIGVAGYFVAKHIDKKTTTPPTTSATTKTSTSTTANPYAGWKSYTSSDDTFSIKYPSAWSYKATPASGCDYTNCQEFDAFGPASQPYSPVVDIYEIKSTLGPEQFQKDNTQYASATMSDVNSNSINGYSAYYFQDTQQTGGSPSEIQSDVYAISHNGLIVWLTLPYQSENSSPYNLIIKSISFDN